MVPETASAAERLDRQGSDWWRAIVLLAGYFATVAALEYSLATGQSALAAAGYVLLTFLLVSLTAALCPDDVNASRRHLWLKTPRAWIGAFCFPLGVASALRLLSLALVDVDLPGQLFPIEVFALPSYAAIGALILPLVYIGQSVFALPIGPGYFGLPRRQTLEPSSFAVVLTGLPLGLLAFLLHRPESPITVSSLEGALSQVMILCLLVALPEETLFRGLILRLLAPIFGTGATVIAAMIYAVFLTGTLSTLQIAFAFGMSLLFGWHVERHGTIIPVMLAHGVLLTGLYLFWPLIF